MRTLGADTRWPPDAGAEVAAVLHHYTWAVRPEVSAESLDVLVALEELQAWLEDKRPYNGKHHRSWESAVGDAA